MLKHADKSGTAIELLRALTAGDLRPEALSIRERQMCVELLREEGHTIGQVAAVLGVSRSTIGRDERAIAERYAKAADLLAPALRAYRLERTAERVKRKATDEKDWALVWRVERELQQALADLLKETRGSDGRASDADRFDFGQLGPQATQLLLEAVEAELARRGQTA